MAISQVKKVDARYVCNGYWIIEKNQNISLIY